MHVNFVVQNFSIRFGVQVENVGNFAVPGVAFAELVNGINFYHVEGVLPVNVHLGVQIDRNYNGNLQIFFRALLKLWDNEGC